jgi:hypothetical protein
MNVGDLVSRRHALPYTGASLNDIGIIIKIHVPTRIRGHIAEVIWSHSHHNEYHGENTLVVL